MTQQSLRISALWDRAALVERDGSATLMIQIVAPASSGEERPALDIAFIIDRSGSMGGQPLQLARQAVSHAVGMLDWKDRAALTVYDDKVEQLFGLAEMSAHGRNELRQALARVDARGSTDLCAGWLMGCRELTRDERPASKERIRRAILLTDGLANQGETDPEVIYRHASELRRREIGTSTLGMGLDFDESLLAGMAEAGGGNFVYIEAASQLPRTFERELGQLARTTATHVNLRLLLPDGLHGELLNPFPVERQGRRFDVTIDDLSSSDEVVLIFAITGRALAKGMRLPFELSIRWTDPVARGRQTEVIAIDTLEVVEPDRYDRMPVDEGVMVQSALVRAAAAQREAMELDRAGRRSDSRAMHAVAFDLLMAAPLPADDRHLRDEAQAYAAFDANVAFSEHSRKQATHNAVRRTRRGGTSER